jgi:hypothetical protein
MRIVGRNSSPPSENNNKGNRNSVQNNQASFSSSVDKSTVSKLLKLELEIRSLVWPECSYAPCDIGGSISFGAGRWRRKVYMPAHAVEMANSSLEYLYQYIYHHEVKVEVRHTS